MCQKVKFLLPVNTMYLNTDMAIFQYARLPMLIENNENNENNHSSNE